MFYMLKRVNSNFSKIIVGLQRKVVFAKLFYSKENYVREIRRRRDEIS